MSPTNGQDANGHANGHNGDPIKTGGNGRSPTGQFLPGGPGGPGRPKAMDFRKVAQAKAKEHGIDLEEALWQVLHSQIQRAIGNSKTPGDPTSAKLVADRLCGMLEKPAEVNIDARTVSINGPPVPKPAELAEHVKRLAELSADFLEGEDDA